MPPATVTASLIARVSVTTWPALRSPLPLVIPVPDVTTDAIVGATAGGGGRYSARECVTSGILDVGAVVVDRAHCQTSGGVPGGRRIAEGQRIGAGAARVDSRPAAGERRASGFRP